MSAFEKFKVASIFLLVDWYGPKVISITN